MTIEQPENIEIAVPAELLTGVYANVAAVSTQTPHDVTLDFIQMVPGSPPQAVVVARLKLAPSFLMPLMRVLSDHLGRHEQLQQASESAAFPDLPASDDDDQEES